MSNKLISSLIKGNVNFKNNIVFNNALPHYFVEYQNGLIGCYTQGPKTSFTAYTEYNVNLDGSISQSTNGTRNLFLGGYLNNFYKAIVDNNYRYANLASIELNKVTEVNPYFITNIYWYNPKSINQIEIIDLNIFAMNEEQKNKIKSNLNYYKIASANNKVLSSKNDLINGIRLFIIKLITDNQKSGSNNWTASGMLALNLRPHLNTPTGPLTLYKNFVIKTKEIGASTQPDFNGIVMLALMDTEYTLARVVDLAITPFIYLYPRGANMPDILPAISETDMTARVANIKELSVSNLDTKELEIIDVVTLPVIKVEQTPQSGKNKYFKSKQLTASTTIKDTKQEINDPAIVINVVDDVVSAPEAPTEPVVTNELTTAIETTSNVKDSSEVILDSTIINPGI